MCKTTTNRASKGERLRRVHSNTVGGSGPGTGAPFLEGPAPLFAGAEFLPQITFIATPTPNDNGFIGNAETFHRNAGLEPISITSLQEAVELLNNATRTGSGVIDHLRIVSHFFVDDENPGFAPSNIKMAMLSGGGRGILKHHFEGWAQSNYEGLKAMVTVFVINSGTLTPRVGVYAHSLKFILNKLRPTHNAIIDQLPTDPIDGEPTGFAKDFVTFAASKWLLADQPTFLPTVRNSLLTAYDLLLANLKTRISTPSAANLTTLENAMVALRNIGAVTVVSPANLAYFSANVTAGITAFQNDFFATVTTMRRRINQFSTVDIRGCQAGQDLDYLRAIRRFFGISDLVRPGVTAPDRFQRFNGINQITGLNSQNDINSIHSSGISPFNATTTRNQFEDWATAFGITQGHLEFWKTTFQLHVLEFCKLQWRGNIPSRRVAISRLNVLATAGLSDMFTRLADIFFFTSAQQPSATQVNTITPLLGNLTAWTTELNGIIPDTATATQLQQHFNTLKSIYENVEPRTAQSSFSARLIPQTAPSSLTVSQVRTWQQSLKAFIDTDSHSIFSPVRRFLAAGFAQANASQSKMRYFLRLGLVFQLYHATSTNFGEQIIVAYSDGTGTNRRENEAIRHWIRSLWRGVNPPNIPAAISWDNGRNTAWIVEGRQQGPSYVCPNISYDQHIIKLSASAP